MATRPGVLGAVLVAAAASVPDGAAALVRGVSGRLTSPVTDLLADLAVTDHVGWAGLEQEFFGANPNSVVRIDLNFTAGDGDGGGGTDEGGANSTAAAGIGRLPVYVVVAPPEEIDALEDSARVAGGVSGACGGATLSRFEVPVASGISRAVTVGQVRRVTVLVLDCNRVRPRVTGSVVVRTAEGGHLGVEQRLLPAVGALLACLYAGVLLVWAADMVRCRGRDVNLVHYSVALALASRLLFHAHRYHMHRRQDETGRVSELALDTNTLLEDASDMAGLFALLVLASGLATVRRAVQKRERQVAYGLFGCYSTLSVITIVCVAEWLCGVAQVLKIVCLSFILIAIIVLLNVTILALRSELPETRWLAGAGDLYAKYSVFWWFRNHFLAFLMLPTAALASREIWLGWRDEWAYDLCRQTAQLLIEVVIISPFRPRKGSALFRLHVR